MTATTVTSEPPADPRHDVQSIHRLTGAYLIVALSALAIGNLPSIFQALSYAGVDLYPEIRPLIHSYYQGLTLHGVMNVLVWTTFFICGFLSFVTVYALGRPLVHMRLAWATFWVMVGGLLLAAWPILANQASVLFTFYAPMQAHWAFYVGLTLVVAGTWGVTGLLIATWRQWQREHPGMRSPLAVFGTLITFVMWSIASVGLAILMVVKLIPWSLGIVDSVDPLLATTLFWFTGHPIVYFWLLPAYVSWYTMVPLMAGGRLYSEPMARVSFILFLLYSIPVGLHHQFTDPGISQNLKLLHALFTFAVFFPSLLTYFNVGASLESAGRRAGGRGWFDWMFKLPWGNPAFTAQIAGMVLFVFGGIGGLTNASYNVNLVISNTTWIVGHIHLTVGAAVTLTFFGITYWLIPFLSGRALWSAKLALVQIATWFVGMAIFAETLHRLGLEYYPRRTFIAQTPWVADEFNLSLFLVGVGGVILFISGLLYFTVILLTVFVSREPANVVMPLQLGGREGSHEHVPELLDRWKPWLIGATILILIAYAPVFFGLLRNISSVPGFQRIW